MEIGNIDIAGDRVLVRWRESKAYAWTIQALSIPPKIQFLIEDALGNEIRLKNMELAQAAEKASEETK